MPEISRFYGIIIRMFFNDHLPPHFHASYSEYGAQIDIRTGDILMANYPEEHFDWFKIGQNFTEQS